MISTVFTSVNGRGEVHCLTAINSVFLALNSNQVEMHNRLEDLLAPEGLPSRHPAEPSHLHNPYLGLFDDSHPKDPYQDPPLLHFLH